LHSVQQAWRVADEEKKKESVAKRKSANMYVGRPNNKFSLTDQKSGAKGKPLVPGLLKK